MSEISLYIKERIAQGVSREVIATELDSKYSKEQYMKYLIDFPDPDALRQTARERQAMAGLIFTAALIIAVNGMLNGAIISALLVFIIYSLVAWYAYTLMGSAATASIGLLSLMMLERLIYLFRSLLSGYSIAFPVIELVLLGVAVFILLRLRLRLHPKYTLAMLFDRLGLYDLWRED